MVILNISLGKGVVVISLTRRPSNKAMLSHCPRLIFLKLDSLTVRSGLVAIEETITAEVPEKCS